MAHNLEECVKLKSSSNKTSVHITTSNISPSSSLVAKPFHGAAFQNHLPELFSVVGKELCLHVDDLVDDRGSNEPPPPGFEDNVRIFASSHVSKFRPSGSNECIPKIGEHVATAMCRQRLHEDVLRELKLSFIDSTLHQFLSSCRISKKLRKLERYEVLSSFLNISPSLSPPSPVTLKYFHRIAITFFIVLVCRKEQTMQITYIQEVFYETNLGKNQSIVPFLAQWKLQHQLVNIRISVRRYLGRSWALLHWLLQSTVGYKIM